MMKFFLIFIAIVGVSAIASFIISLFWSFGRRFYLRGKRYRGPVERKAGQHYYTIVGPLSNLWVKSYIDAGTLFDMRNYQKGIYFLSESDALKRVDEIEELNRR